MCNSPFINSAPFDECLNLKCIVTMTRIVSVMMTRMMMMMTVAVLRMKMIVIALAVIVASIGWPLASPGCPTPPRLDCRIPPR